METQFFVEKIPSPEVPYLVEKEQGPFALEIVGEISIFAVFNNHHEGPCNQSNTSSVSHLPASVGLGVSNRLVFILASSAGIPGLGRLPGEGNGNPPQYSCLENPMDRGA